MVLISALLLAACTAVDAPALEPPSFGQGRVTLHTAAGEHTISVYIAETREARRIGLRGRDHLAADRGMLFLFEADRTAGFWMHGVRIPLDIAFADAEGAVLRVMRMKPCRARLAIFCPSYRPGVPYRMALEVNAGWLAAHGVAPGDRIDINRSRESPSGR